MIRKTKDEIENKKTYVTNLIIWRVGTTAGTNGYSINIFLGKWIPHVAHTTYLLTNHCIDAAWDILENR